ncbi:MAG: nucleotidyltransferase domain-containing protein [Chloroflexi bacterium]|nr:nucleotidyltransferase domain-containing protein [Chloroflexota bacterium]
MQKGNVTNQILGSFLMLPIDLRRVLDLWPLPRPQAIALLGSYARGDAGPFSDVDLLFLLPAGAAKPERNTFLIDGYLVVVTAVTPEQIDGWFTEPEQAVNVVAALRDAIPLQDPDSLFAAVQSRAHAFAWTAELQAKADRYASRAMVGWIEESHKGLEGLRRNDTGRLLNARFGLSWGLAGLMRVQRGILGNSDNGFYDDVRNALGRESRWSRLLSTTFGAATSASALFSLHEEVIAGLRLYCETTRLLADALQPEDRPLIESTVARIEQAISGL